MNRINLVFLFLITVSVSDAQQYAAFQDITNSFSVFENGRKKVLEYNTINNYQVGGKGVVYVDNQERLKVYQEGKTYETRLTNPSAYYATDDLIIFNVGQQLLDFNKGKFTLLTSWAAHYKVGDSVVLFYDQLKNSFNTYYQGKVFPVEENLTGDIGNYWVGDNIAAYVNPDGYFKAFYQGKTTELLFNAVIKGVETGKNTMAFINDNNGTFNVLYKDELFELEDFTPKWYKVGDDFVAYYSNDNVFKVFYKGKEQILGYFDPQKISVRDDVMAFTHDNLFKVFYKGKITQLESYIPSNFVLDYQTLVYVDPYGNLKGFSEGQLKNNIASSVRTFKVSYNIISFDLGNNNTKVYYKNTIY